MKFVLHSVFVFLSLGVFAQKDSTFMLREAQLKDYLADLRSASTLEEKDAKNEVFKSYLLETINLNGAFDYPFAQLKSLGSIKSPDNTFRLFNWNVEQENRTNKYYCFVLRFDEKKKDWKITELVDNSENLPKQPKDILDESNWYGALYYKIIPVEKSGKTLYTVLGWDGNNPSSNIKLIDVLSFSGNHVKLGSPIFKMSDGTHKRVFFEHSNKAFMSLNYDESSKTIVFDHLSPETPSLIGFYEYYVPDMSYDQLVLSNKKWVIDENIVSVNGKESKSYTLQHINKKTGEVVSKNVKNKWQDPTDLAAPGGANQHIAKLPGDDLKEKGSSESKTQNSNEVPKISKKQKKGEFSMNPFLKGKKYK